MKDNWEAISYVLQSDYRTEVVSMLAQANQATPSQLSTETDIAQPNVSRALSELKEKGVVELLVPEETKRGRYYGLTDMGETVFERIREVEDEFTWNHRDPETDRERRLLNYLREEFGDHLRAVACREAHDVTLLYMDQEVRSQYTPEEMESDLRKFLYDEIARKYGDRDLNYLVRGFSDYVSVRVFIDDDTEVSVSVCPDYTFETDALARDVTDIVAEAEQ